MRRLQSGFTLLEVLLATSLLAAGLVLAFSTLHSAAMVARRGEAIANQTDNIRTVEDLLRRQLSGALAQPLELPKQDQPPPVFIGEPQQMRFVASIPDYLGQGGAYVHQLSVDEHAGKRQLQLQLSMLQGGVVLTGLPAEPLLEKPEGLHFSYRGINPDTGKLEGWQDTWQWPQQLPLLVRIELGSQGEAWPPLTVALPQSPVQTARGAP